MPIHQVRHVGLRNAQNIGNFALFQFFVFQNSKDMKPDLRARQKPIGVFQPQIGKDVPRPLFKLNWFSSFRTHAPTPGSFSFEFPSQTTGRSTGGLACPNRTSSRYSRFTIMSNPIPHLQRLYGRRQIPRILPNMLPSNPEPTTAVKPIIKLLLLTALILLGNPLLLAADRGVLVREAVIYLSPDTSSSKLGQVERGRELVLLDKSRNWLHVEALLGFAQTPDPAFVEDEDVEGKTISGWVLDTGVVWASTP